MELFQVNSLGKSQRKSSKNSGSIARKHCYDRVIWKKFQTVLIIETVRLSIILLMLRLYGTYNRVIYKKIQTVRIIETVLIIVLDPEASLVRYLYRTVIGFKKPME